MGWSVAGAGDVNGDGFADVLVGAPYYDSGETDEGAVFVFIGSATGVASASAAGAHARIESNEADLRMGEEVASAGDVNGDGFSDVIVGVVGYDGGQTDEGAAFVFLGSANGIASESIAGADARLESDQANAAMGCSVASAGDVNGDGYADVIVGAAGYNAGQAHTGAVFVFLGSASGVASGSPGGAHAKLESDRTPSALGWSAASAGDVNGDGYADVIVGASSYSTGQTGEGAAFVFLGSAGGIANGNLTGADARLEGNQVDAYMGRSVASAGDVNGDGYGDVIVGA
jgi:hypothetical protein